MIKTILSILICVFFLASCSHAPTKKETKGTVSSEQMAMGITHEGRFDVIPVVGKFVAKRAVLKNGLKIIFLKDESSPTFAYQTWFKVGSRNEVMGKTGLAHLFEHMMFKGTTHHPEGEFDALLEKAGVEGENAFTSNDHTAYIQELPNTQFNLIASLESDRMVNLIVNDQSFKTEREVVKNERRMRNENSPEGTLYQSLYETTFTDSPYHWPVIGYEQDLNLMSAQDARDFYEKYYSPDRATVIIVGDVDEDKALKTLEKYYGNIPGKNTPDGLIKVDAEQTAQKRKKIPLNIQNEKLWLAYKIPEARSPDAPVFEVIQALLTDGMNSRLNRALVDTGISTNVGSGSFSLRDPGIFTVVTDLQKGKSSFLAEPIILREIERLKSNLVNADELARAKNLVRFHFYEKLSTNDGKANFIGESETQFGGLEAGIQFHEKILAVTPEMVQDVATRYLVTQHLTVLVGTPKATPASGKKK